LVDKYFKTPTCRAAESGFITALPRRLDFARKIAMTEESSACLVFADGDVEDVSAKGTIKLSTQYEANPPTDDDMLAELEEF
jgi:hypothetical protein